MRKNDEGNNLYVHLSEPFKLSTKDDQYHHRYHKSNKRLILKKTTSPTIME